MHLSFVVFFFGLSFGLGALTIEWFHGNVKTSIPIVKHGRIRDVRKNTSIALPIRDYPLILNRFQFQRPGRVTIDLEARQPAAQVELNLLELAVWQVPAER